MEVPERIEAYPWETGRRTRNLMFYVAPFTGSPWRRHTAILRRSMRLFSGVKIISCVTGPGLDAADEVREELAGFGCYWLEFPHDPQLGEVVAWRDGMLRLREAAAPGSVTFYGHTKGVARHALAESATGHHWGEVMYETCLDYLPLVDGMLDHHVFAGPFRRVIPLGQSKWHYSGTFYWFRQDEIWKREWDCVERRYAGGESWPRLVASLEESGCLFFDHTFHGESNPYDLGGFQRVIDPDYEFWKGVTRDFRTPGAYGVLGPYEAEKLGLYARQS